MNWPVEIQEWRDAELAANSCHPLLAHLLTIEDRIRTQFGVDPATNVVNKDIRAIMWAELASYFAESDAEKSKCQTLVADARVQYKHGVH